MPTFFIDRPNFAWVIAIFITLAGLLAIRLLPVSQFPVVAPPQIMITATYPGASATMVVDSVTSIIEEELNGAKGLLYFDSTASSAGTAEITVTFEPGTNPDLAQVDVQNRLQNAQSRLPASVVQQGIHVEQANSGFLLMYTLGYKDGAGQGRVNLDDYAVRSVNNEISRIPGVGRVQFFGAEAAMRIWIDPQKLVGYGLSVTDVNNAIAAQNVQVPAGSFGSKPGIVQSIAPGVPSDLITGRPDVIAAEHRLMARNADIGAARAAFFPRISLTGVAGTSSAELSGLFGAGQGMWSFMPQVSLPLFSGGRNRANLELASLRKDAAIAAYEQTIQTAFREVADALAAKDTLNREEAARKALVASDNKALAIARARYSAGVDDYLRYLQSERNTFDNELALISTMTQRQQAIVSLFTALGGGWKKGEQADTAYVANR
ncbi:efflux RND transporter permease subunit [Dickeya chrysanthemi]|uniref:efflux RND transporter permease subunit n=1 Tax=Dickeya chrysanthemi TaxID=556 RepID=UPI000907A972|nr:efflux RND transporter permease subunit [Dickeya chrysanthemi]